VEAPGRTWPLGRFAYFGGYRRTAGGRLVGARYRPGMAGWRAMDHGSPWNGAGYDEIMVIARSEQMSLFPPDAGAVGRRAV
jgi:hypothetical protein